MFIVGVINQNFAVVPYTYACILPLLIPPTALVALNAHGLSKTVGICKSLVYTVSVKAPFLKVQHSSGAILNDSPQGSCEIAPQGVCTEISV